MKLGVQKRIRQLHKFLREAFPPRNTHLFDLIGTELLVPQLTADCSLFDSTVSIDLRSTTSIRNTYPPTM